MGTLQPQYRFVLEAGGPSSALPVALPASDWRTGPRVSAVLRAPLLQQTLEATAHLGEAWLTKGGGPAP